MIYNIASRRAARLPGVGVLQYWRCHAALCCANSIAGETNAGRRTRSAASAKRRAPAKALLRRSLRR
ncbi:hypothetical protein DQP58_24695 [Mycobacterium colombiense]|uniref:Uncharacterized protein n=1 Tax=Mycobacterium colombiense TaxID=339268 RepID=A0A329K5F8_9MYCO|nr:hypothetical protein DQP58_24695 [Mycobacterium colombiense]